MRWMMAASALLLASGCMEQRPDGSYHILPSRQEKALSNAEAVKKARRLQQTFDQRARELSGQAARQLGPIDRSARRTSAAEIHTPARKTSRSSRHPSSKDESEDRAKAREPTKTPSLPEVRK